MTRNADLLEDDPFKSILNQSRSPSVVMGEPMEDGSGAGRSVEGGGGGGGDEDPPKGALDEESPLRNSRSMGQWRLV